MEIAVIVAVISWCGCDEKWEWESFGGRGLLGLFWRSGQSERLKLEIGGVMFHVVRGYAPQAECE